MPGSNLGLKTWQQHQDVTPSVQEVMWRMLTVNYDCMLEALTAAGAAADPIAHCQLDSGF